MIKLSILASISISISYLLLITNFLFLNSMAKNNYRLEKTGYSIMDNTETLETLGTQGTGRR